MTLCGVDSAAGFIFRFRSRGLSPATASAPRGKAFCVLHFLRNPQRLERCLVHSRRSISSSCMEGEVGLGGAGARGVELASSRGAASGCVPGTPSAVQGQRWRASLSREWPAPRRGPRSAGHRLWCAHVPCGSSREETEAQAHRRPPRGATARPRGRSLLSAGVQPLLARLRSSWGSIKLVSPPDNS